MFWEYWTTGNTQPERTRSEKAEPHLKVPDDNEGHGEVRTYSHLKSGPDDGYDTQQEFYKLLHESNFVPRVIEIHLKNKARLIEVDLRASAPASSENHYEWQVLVIRILPDWLFWITDLLTTQAKLVATGRAMPRNQLAALLRSPTHLCRETLERIAREGRKFGLGLVSVFSTPIGTFSDGACSMEYISLASNCE